MPLQPRHCWRDIRCLQAYRARADRVCPQFLRPGQATGWFLRTWPKEPRRLGNLRHATWRHAVRHFRSEERRVGKECGSRVWAGQEKREKRHLVEVSEER